MNTLIKAIPTKVLAYYLTVLATAAFLCASPSLRASEPTDHGLTFPGDPVPNQKFETSTNLAPVIVVFLVIWAAGTKLNTVEKSQDSLASLL